MCKLYTLVFLLFSFYSFSQEDSSEDSRQLHKSQVKQTIIGFFEGFHQGDTIKMKEFMAENMVLHTIINTSNEEKEVERTNIEKFLTVIHNRPKEQQWEEILLSFKIEANSDIAQVWTPYEFYVNDVFSHCGVNVFQLFFDGKRWMITSIMDTRNKDKDRCVK